MNDLADLDYLAFVLNILYNIFVPISVRVLLAALPGGKGCACVLFR